MSDRLHSSLAGPANALTIDVEDYFQVSAFAPHIPRAEWDARECRVERNVDSILAMLDDRGVHATFFTLGWVAERYPALVRRIVENGHELASHGFGHHRATDHDERFFYSDIHLAKLVLEDTGGVEVHGYRAPSFSIGAQNPWAFDCIERAGYRYSSSVYPIRHDHYGIPDAPRAPYQVGSGLVEIPITTVRALGRNFPAGGGGYFRLLPYFISRWMIERVNAVEGRSAIFYFHPWEIDIDQPRVPGVAIKARFRHYVNLDRMKGKLERLLDDFRWGRVDAVFFGDPGITNVPFAVPMTDGRLSGDVHAVAHSS